MAGERQELQNKAQREIAAILAGLEKDTGMLVRKISLDEVDRTTFDDDTPTYRMSVRIELIRMPGHDWAV